MSSPIPIFIALEGREFNADLTFDYTPAIVGNINCLAEHSEEPQDEDYNLIELIAHFPNGLFTETGKPKTYPVDLSGLIAPLEKELIEKIIEWRNER